MGKRKKDKGKKKLNTKKIAKALNADKVVGPRRFDKNGREYFELIVIRGRKSQARKIYRLTSKDLDTGGYKFLCEAEGQFFLHCFSIVGKYNSSVRDRIYGYVTENPTQKGMQIRVVFYEKA